MRTARVINWKEIESKAKKMTATELYYAYMDCFKTSNLGMPNDGYYSDCASVYHNELVKRKNKFKKPTEKIQIIFDRIANEEYPKLSMKRKRELYSDYNIDSGTDYARYILSEIVYDKDGASLY